MPKTTHLRLVKQPFQFDHPVNEVYDDWNNGLCDHDGVIDRCKQLRSVVEYDAVSMTDGINMALDLGDLNWGELVACLALHRSGCWGLASEAQAYRNGREDCQISIWHPPSSKRQKVQIVSRGHAVTFTLLDEVL